MTIGGIMNSYQECIYCDTLYDCDNNYDKDYVKRCTKRKKLNGKLEVVRNES